MQSSSSVSSRSLTETVRRPWRAERPPPFETALVTSSFAVEGRPRPWPGLSVLLPGTRRHRDETCRVAETCKDRAGAPTESADGREAARTCAALTCRLCEAMGEDTKLLEQARRGICRVLFTGDPPKPYASRANKTDSGCLLYTSDAADE